MNNLLEDIQSKGYLILNEKDIFTKNFLSAFKYVFNDIINNEDTYFKKVRYHTDGYKNINNKEDLQKIIKEELDNPNWFQLWKTANIPRQKYHIISSYLKKITNEIYNIENFNDSNISSSEFTCFNKGCAIIPHVDKSEDSTNRICGILSYINTDWKQEFGGNLIIDNDVTIVPTAGTIVVLDFTKNNILHEVSEVIEDKSRFCLTSFIKNNNAN